MNAVSTMLPRNPGHMFIRMLVVCIHMCFWAAACKQIGPAPYYLCVCVCVCVCNYVYVCVCTGTYICETVTNFGRRQVCVYVYHIYSIIRTH